MKPHRVPAAAGGRELGGAERGDHRRAGGGPADAAPRRRALGRGSVDRGAAASAGDARSPARDLPAWSRGWPTKFGHVRVDRVTYSVPIRHALPAGVGEAVSRPGGDRGRRRGGRRASPGVHAGARKSSMRFTCCRCWSGSTGPWPRRRRFSTGGWPRCGSRRGRELAKHTRKPDQEWVRSWRRSRGRAGADARTHRGPAGEAAPAPPSVARSSCGPRFRSIVPAVSSSATTVPQKTPRAWVDGRRFAKEVAEVDTAPW